MIYLVFKVVGKIDKYFLKSNIFIFLHLNSFHRYLLACCHGYISQNQDFVKKNDSLSYYFVRIFTREESDILIYNINQNWLLWICTSMLAGIIC